MEPRSITTPFGRRPMTLALAKRQLETSKIRAGKIVEKWKVFRHVTEARRELELHDRSMAVLNALLTFYPQNELREGEQLVVFPSNAQLSLRSHGIAGATLRRHLALLVNAGLIIRRDSANGKRYARRDSAGGIEDAYGFDLSPLLARAEELAMMANDVVAARTALRRSKETLTICRRDVRKLIMAAKAEAVQGDWAVIEGTYAQILARFPRSPSSLDVTAALSEMQQLYADLLSLLKKHEDSQKMSTNDARDEQHIQSSESESVTDVEACSGNEVEEKTVNSGNQQTLPLATVLRACPQILDYGPGGSIRSWRDLMSAAVVVRSMLGVSPSAYQAACTTLGPENAAVATACILERAESISSAGGYLRDLTRRAAIGKFSLVPIIMSQLRAGETRLAS